MTQKLLNNLSGFLTSSGLAFLGYDLDVKGLFWAAILALLLYAFAMAFPKKFSK